ncbi:MAG: phenylalanine--tRNA ligase subunit beta [Gemmatimonadales bacterium]
MKVSRRWLEAFLRRPLDSRDVAARLAMLGAPVDAIAPVGADLGAFVVGLVTSVQPHPDADKLRVTTVDEGSGTLFTVVCGAPNVAAGAKYPFARLGTTMPGGLVIEKRKLRGVASEGMLCSARELGLGQDHDGLLTLETDAAPGTPLVNVLDVGDEQLEIDVTPNRPDLLGHKGVARELATSYGIPYRLPDVPGLADVDLPTPVRYTDEATVGGVRLAVSDTGCGRFLGAVIRGVKIGPSPEWLRRRLESVGSRSINNVVDVSNYILLELNQPTHAYDAATLRGPAIIARAAHAGESVTTLDGVARPIAEGTLVIADAERIIGIAGVMGGRDTEVTDGTTDVFLECAWFDPSRVRKARRSVGLSTDASQRFERGTDRWGAVDAFRRCIRMIITVAGGHLDGDTVDCTPVPAFPPRIFLRPARVAQVLGVTMPWIEIEKHLVAIGATVVSKPDDQRIAVDVPGWRPDITSEIDLVEEIARLHGYENIPVDLRPFRPAQRSDDTGWGAAARVRVGLAALGLSEVMTLPMVSDESAVAPRLLNPLSAEHGMLRSTLVPSLVRHVESNWANHVGDVRLFEVGTTFRHTAAGSPPAESLRAAFAVTGARQPAHWSAAGKSAPWDAWDARALFEGLVALAQPDATVQVDGGTWVAIDRSGSVVGRCAPVAADAPPWATAVYAGEITVAEQGRPEADFRGTPAFPSSTRDLALLVPVTRPVVEITTLLESRGKRQGLESVTVVDEYRGASLPPGTRSVAVRLVFRATDRTLTDTEVEQAVGRLRTSLERELDVTLRST